MMESLTSAAYRNKVLGGWVGKCAGGILGAPIEGYKVFNSIPLSDDLFVSNFANDDLDLQVLWLDMVSKKGPWVRAADFAEHWRNHVAFPWNEYGIATRNIKLGLDGPDTGRHNNWYWNESMGSPIRSEIWGMLFPGQPERAAAYAKLDSELDHVDFSVHAEMYFSACAALAFVEEDPRRLLHRALTHIPAGGVCADLVGRVSGWYDNHGFEVTAGKIKSFYGDADFTAAPMNVGFTILSLLHAGTDFDRIIRALHLGHDSDCIVATAGAILGILRGHEQIPGLWKERVGNELLISPEVSGIRCPATLTELAEWTCEVGEKIAAGWPRPERPFALTSTVAAWPDPVSGSPLEIDLHLENFTDQPLDLDIAISSDRFVTDRGEPIRSVLPKNGTSSHHSLILPAHHPTGNLAHHPYTIRVTLAGTTYTFPRGLPDYGAWLLLGPFITADIALAPMDDDYPDHGMSSLPSVRYMNHDRVNSPDQEFADHPLIERLLAGEGRDAQPFGVSLVRPTSMSMDLADHFHGRGERTLLLTTQLHTDRPLHRWLCVGTTAYLTVFLNGERISVSRESRRRWPGTEVTEFELPAGTSTLTLQFDTITDDYRVDVGFKEHAGKHHHQSHWDTELVPTVPYTSDNPARAVPGVETSDVEARTN